ncbi:MAG: transcriptional regulator, MarR family [Nevskia sp.]|nr:transcriptional regulator, MarR family [Nevskia sp.]
MAAPHNSKKKAASSARSKPAVKTKSTGTSASKRKNSGDKETSASGVISTQSRDDIRLSFLIHDVSRMRRAVYDQFMKPLGITRAQWWVLAHLSRSDGMMQTQLADVLDVGKASLGDVIGSLESGGWVARMSDPSDKRAKRVFLTPPAQSLIKRMTVMEVQFNDRVFAKLSLEERTKLFDMMLTIKQSLSQLSANGNIDSAD